MKKLFKVFLGVLVVITLFVATLFVFRNQIAEVVIEKLGTAAAGAKVEVDGVEIYIVECRARWDRIQVTNKKNTWENLFETETCEFSFEFKPLLAGKMIVETMVVDGFKTGTDRATDGKITESANKKSENSKPSWIKTVALNQLEKEKQNIPVLNPGMFEKKVDADTIIAALELKTPGKIEKLQAFAEERYSYWEARLKKNNYEERLKVIGKNAKAIDVKKIKKIDDFKKSISKADKVIKKSKKLRSEIKNEKKQLKQDLTQIRNSAKQIPDWIKEDYETALRKAKLVDFSAENISKMLFGDRVTNLIMMVLDKVEKTRQMAVGHPVSTENAKKEKMPELPDFWIKDMAMTAVLQNGLSLKGTVTDISNSQKKTGKPFVIKLQGQSEKTGTISIEALMDYRNTQLSDELKVTIIKLPVRDVKLADSPVFPGKIKKANLNISAELTVQNDSMASEIEVNMTDVKFDYSTIKNPKKKTAKIAKRVAEKLNGIVLKCTISSVKDKMNIKLDSNVDEILSSEIKGVLSDEVSVAKAKIKNKLNGKLGGYQGDFIKKNDLKDKELNGLMSILDNDSAGKDKVIDSKKKELEKKLKKKLEKKVKKAGKDLLEKLKLKF